MKLSYEIFVRHEVYQILQKVSADDRERFCYFVGFRHGSAVSHPLGLLLPPVAPLAIALRSPAQVAALSNGNRGA